MQNPLEIQILCVVWRRHPAINRQQELGSESSQHRPTFVTSSSLSSIIIITLIIIITIIIIIIIIIRMLDGDEYSDPLLMLSANQC